MSKLAQVWCNGFYLSNKPIERGYYKRSIRRIPLGLLVRKQLGKRIIFRVRRGNGVAGSIQGEIYQDKMTYFVPASITNTEGQPARDLLSSAVVNWQTSLSEEQKSSYNERATHGLRMSGYNLYIREYILTNV